MVVTVAEKHNVAVSQVEQMLQSGLSINDYHINVTATGKLRYYQSKKSYIDSTLFSQYRFNVIWLKLNDF